MTLEAKRGRDWPWRRWQSAPPRASASATSGKASRLLGLLCATVAAVLGPARLIWGAKLLRTGLRAGHERGRGFLRLSSSGLQRGFEILGRGTLTLLVLLVDGGGRLASLLWRGLRLLGNGLLRLTRATAREAVDIARELFWALSSEEEPEDLETPVVPSDRPPVRLGG